MNALEALVQAAPYFKQIFPQDVMIGITDQEVFVYYEPSAKVNFGDMVGKPVPKEDPTINGALSGQVCMERVSAELYGHSFVSKAIPVLGPEGEVLGAFAVAYTLETEEQMEKLTGEVESISGHLVDMVQSVAAQSEELSATTAQILENTRRAVSQSEQVNEVTGFIREISETTNLLGLNAAIEAARVGELGAGFGVVASEVRKLSVHTKEATEKIEAALRDVQRSIKQMEQEIASIAASSNAQAELVTEFSGAIDDLNRASGQMQTFMHSLLLGTSR
ncbi:putative sensory transducer protein YfmS [Paenibacillus sp. J31TS4]|uniref:methyl-accepting chemotaxis protein n=1 Tax=Paenibacillus sp. J31TS4 TaxID=2807195 RepID=UPI001B024A72|nr:methyl-accepting chemotaxis protein [Paenibacillus sp. J31TS4]GIP40535.1 putative sensory transducer protein YfmS [Paenibacillus sp. J31TS4]